jgi:hypothetical protein
MHGSPIASPFYCYPSGWRTIPGIFIIRSWPRPAIAPSGHHAVDLTTGQTLYQRNTGIPLAPASYKLFSTALGLLRRSDYVEHASWPPVPRMPMAAWQRIWSWPEAATPRCRPALFPTTRADSGRPLAPMAGWRTRSCNPASASSGAI